MAVLVNQDTQVIIQGITGKQGRTHTKLMQNYNVQVVAGTSPGKGGQEVYGVPVYDAVATATAEHSINASMVIVPPPFVLSAATEAIEQRIPLVVIITEHVPVHDSIRIKQLADQYGVTVVGPNTIGVISPGKGKVGIMPGYIYSEGQIGVISRSGTLTHEVSSNLTYRGYGQSTCIGIGGDPVVGTDFVEALKLFREDDETQLIILIGEIGGVGEEKAAQYIKETNYPKPIVAFIAGQTAPKGKKMGHAGAIISGNMGSAESKMKLLGEAGVQVAETLDQILEIVEKSDL